MNYKERKKLNDIFLRNCFKGWMMGDMVRHMKEPERIEGSRLKELWKSYLEETKDKTRKLNFYTHIPYCLNKCSFCLYYSRKLNQADNIGEYVDNLIRNYEYFSDTFKNEIFSSLYFGGGTPNILGDKDIERLFVSLYKNYKFSDTAERTFEGNPLFATESKLKLLKSFGINRLSFGVQSFDLNTLSENKRLVQNHDLVKRAVNIANSAGFDRVNLDLMIGFSGDTVDGFLEGFKKVVDMGVWSICVYPLQARQEYLKKFFNGEEEKFILHRRKLLKGVISEVLEIVSKNGYEIPLFDKMFLETGDGNSLNFRKENIKNFDNKDQYSSDDFYNTSSILGIGEYATGKINGNEIVYQKDGTISSYPELEGYNGIILSKDEMIADDLMKFFSANNTLRLDDFKKRFGIKLSDLYKDEIECLRSGGRIEMTDNELVLYSEDVNERMNDMLFFIREELIMSNIEKAKENIRNEISERRQLHDEVIERGLEYRAMPELMASFSDIKTISGKDVKRLWSDFLKDRKPRKISFYSNTPYCLNRCSFCMYESELITDSNIISDYVDRVIRHYEYFSDTFKDEVFSSLYFGGGTPNILDDKDIERLFVSLYKNYKFSDTAERTFEGNLIFATESKLKLLKSFGINRLSFGVQSFDNSLLFANNRVAQDEGLIRKTVDTALQIGFENVNLDLIVGLNNDSIESFLNSFRKAINANPTSISVYPFFAPSEYVNRFYDGDWEVAIKYRDGMFSEALPEILKIIEGSEYEIPYHNQLFTSPGDGSCFSFRRRGSKEFDSDDQYFIDDATNPNAVFGIGSNAASKTGFGKINCRAKIISLDPENDVFKNTSLSKTDSMIDLLARHFSKNTNIKKQEFKDRFGVNIDDVFGEALDMLELSGSIEREDGQITFKNENIKERINDLLFFVDRQRISNLLNSKSQSNSKGILDSCGSREDQMRTLEKINKIMNDDSLRVVDGNFRSFSDAGVKLILNDEEDVTEMEFAENAIIVLHVIKGKGDEEEILWVEISKEDIPFDERISLVVSKADNKVHIVKKVALV